MKCKRGQGTGSQGRGQVEQKGRKGMAQGIAVEGSGYSRRGECMAGEVGKEGVEGGMGKGGQGKEGREGKRGPERTEQGCRAVGGHWGHSPCTE